MCCYLIILDLVLLILKFNISENESSQMNSLIVKIINSLPCLLVLWNSFHEKQTKRKWHCSTKSSNCYAASLELVSLVPSSTSSFGNADSVVLLIPPDFLLHLHLHHHNLHHWTRLISTVSLLLCVRHRSTCQSCSCTPSRIIMDVFRFPILFGL